MRKIRFKDLEPEQQLKLQIVLNKNKVKTNRAAIKTEFTKQYFESNFWNYLRYN